MSNAVITTDVNRPATVPSTEAKPVEPVQPPAVEKTVAESTPTIENKVPYSRFQEVIQQKNELAHKLEGLEKRLQTHEIAIGVREKQDISAKHVERLVKAGMERDAAELLVSTQVELAKEHVEERVKPLEKIADSQQLESWTTKFAANHPDYDEMSPGMLKVFQSLPERTQQLIVSDEKGLELLYAYVKQNGSTSTMQDKFNEGAKAAYENKGLKQAVSSIPGASTVPPGGITRESVAKMSLEEYSKNRKAIHEALTRKQS